MRNFRLRCDSAHTSPSERNEKRYWAAPPTALPTCTFRRAFDERGDFESATLRRLLTVKGYILQVFYFKVSCCSQRYDLCLVCCSQRYDTISRNDLIVPKFKRFNLHRNFPERHNTTPKQRSFGGEQIDIRSAFVLVQPPQWIASSGFDSVHRPDHVPPICLSGSTAVLELDDLP